MHLLLFTIVIIFASPAFCWTGYNYDTGSYFEVERYDHQGLGEGSVEYYDYDSGEYKSGYLDYFPEQVVFYMTRIQAKNLIYRWSK